MKFKSHLIFWLCCATRLALCTFPGIIWNYESNEKYLVQPIACLLTVFVHEKLQHYCPQGALLLESEDDKEFNYAIQTVFSRFSFDDFQSFLNSPRYSHLTYYFLSNTHCPGLLPLLKVILNKKGLGDFDEESICLGLAEFVRNCIVKFRAELNPSHLVAYVATQHYLLQRPSDDILAQFAPKLRATTLAVLPLKNLAGHQSLEFISAIQYQIITLDHFQVDDLVKFGNFARNENGYRIFDFSSLDFNSPAIDALIDALPNSSINGIIMHYFFESTFVCDRILITLADEIQRLSISWDENVDFVARMQNIAGFKKLSFVGFNDLTGESNTFDHFIGELSNNRIISTLIPSCEEHSKMKVFCIENLLLHVSSKNFELFYPENILAQPILNMKERSLLLSLILGRFYKKTGAHFDFYGDKEVARQKNFLSFKRFIYILDSLLKEISTLMLSIENYDLHYKIEMNYVDVLRDVFGMQKGYFTMNDLFHSFWDIIESSVRAVELGMKSHVPPREISEFDRIVATRHYLSALTINNSEFFNEISSYLLFPSMFELNLLADWLRIPVQNFGVLKTDHLIIYASKKGQCLSQSVLSLETKIKVASRVLLKCKENSFQKLTKTIELFNVMRGQSEFPGISGFVGVLDQGDFLLIRKKLSNIGSEVKVAELCGLSPDFFNCSCGCLRNAVLEMDLVMFGSSYFLKSLYDYVVERDGEVGTRCVIPISNLLELAKAIYGGEFSVASLLSSCPFDSKYLRIYSASEGLTIIDLGSSRKFSVAKRAIQ